MRKRAFAGKQLLFASLFMGLSHFMAARSQTSNWMVAYTQSAIAPASPVEQARAIPSILADARRAFDVDFIYESRILPSAKLEIDIAQFKTVEGFLDELLKPYNLKYKKVLTRAYVIYASSSELKRLMSVIDKEKGIVPDELLNPAIVQTAPQQVITGRIMEEKGMPLEGVSVSVKGSNRGTVTGKDGSFRLDVDNENTVLIISLIGYQTQELTVGKRSSFLLTLSSQSQSLSDVVVIGYGTQKKSVVTGAISSVKASDLEDMPVNRIEESLQGRTSGVTIAANSGSPGSASTVTIRGITSINNSTPLYIVDGVPVDVGGIDFLNQSDIASIEVLKDAASAAIYGTRAAAGVILITTKKGKAGTMQVNYTGSLGTQSPSRKLSLTNATQYAMLRNESSLAAGNGILFTDPQALGKGTDWQGEIFNDHATIQNHELSFSGGNDRSVYYASFGYFDQQGIVMTPISYYKRYTIRLNTAHKIRPWFNFGNNLSYSYIRNQSIGNVNSPYGGPLSSAINLDPITPVIETDPAVLAGNPYSTEPVVKDALGRPYGISDYVGQEITNPLAYAQTQEGYNWSHNIVGNVYTEMGPVKGFKFRSSLGAKLAFYGKQTFSPLFYLNASTNNITNNSFYRENDQGLIWNWDNTLSYTHDFGMHHLTVLVGTGAQENSASGANSTFIGLPVTNISQASMNFNLAASSRVGGGFENQPYTLSSVFGRITYDYAEKYLLTAILRRDGSSRFGDNNKYGNFPSVSVGWVPSKESFWPVGNAVNFLKIRAGYGINGNDQSLTDFQYISTVSGGRNYTFGNDNIIVGYSPNAPANPALRWEQTSQTDIGADATLYKYFRITVDAYDKKTTGMLLQEQIPGYVGAAGEPYGNVASLEDKGLEVEIGYVRKIGSVNLDIGGNASYVTNKITDLGVSNSFFTGATFQSSAYEINRIAVGQPFDAFYGFKTLGIFQNQEQIDTYVGKNGQMIQPGAKPGDFKYADLDGDGQITSADRLYLGDPTPHWTFGFTGRAEFKGFYLATLIQGVMGNKIFQGYRRLDIAAANYSTEALARWTGPGTSNTYPRLVDGDPNGNFSNPSAFYLHDGAYMRVKVLQLGYTIPPALTDRMRFQRIMIYVSANNLITFTKYDGFDPEVGGNSGVASGINTGSGNANNYGVDNGVYPAAKTFQLGINVTF